MLKECEFWSTSPISPEIHERSEKVAIETPQPPPKPVKCDKCSYSCEDKTQLKNHITSAHTERETCGGCKKLIYKPVDHQRCKKMMKQKNSLQRSSRGSANAKDSSSDDQMELVQNQFSNKNYNDNAPNIISGALGPMVKLEK